MEDEAEEKEEIATQHKLQELANWLESSDKEEIGSVAIKQSVHS